MATVSVRYIVKDIGPAVAFYRDHLGFIEQMHHARTFAMLVRGDLRLVLSVPSGSAGAGGRDMPDGTPQTPGGWNRLMIEVEDLDEIVHALRVARVHLRNTIVTGIGGKQVLVEDPSGNPVELFQPTLPEAQLDKA